MKSKSAVILLSGGLDSATAAAAARRDGYILHAMTFSYGQRHDLEVRCAARLADYFGMKSHVVVEIPAGIFSSALIKGSAVAIPRNRDVSSLEGIPDTYVPARNLIFLSYAVAYGESLGATAVYIGVNALDYSGYPDCRPEFIEAFQTAADKGTRAGVSGDGITVTAPLMHMKKSDIISLGVSLGVDYSLTHSCYDPAPDGEACGSCDSCLIRKKGFADAGVPDPTRYVRR